MRFEAGLTKRTVEPLGLMFYGSRWHLVAWCRLRKDVRDFRLDRMESFEVLNECFEGHDDFSIEEFVKWDIEESALIQIELVCERWALETLINQMPAMMDEQTELEGGKFQIRARAYSLEWLARWLISMGTAVQVIQPRELQVLVVEQANKIKGLYD